MKWLLSLVFLTLFFIISSFFLPENLRLSYRFMTLGMASVSFLFYFITQKSSPKNIGGNLLAITAKFLLSAMVFIMYAIIFPSKDKTGYYFFIVAYVLFSIISYVGAHYATKSKAQAA